MFSLAIRDKNGTIVDEGTFEEGEILVGRSQAADVVLPSDNVSRRHVRIYTVEGRCYVEDLNSSNGVFVNGRRIHEVVEIEGSAQVRVGDYYLHVKGDAEAQGKESVYCKLLGGNLSVAGQTFPITRTVNLMGRGKDCTVTIIDPSVSRIHAKLTVERAGTLTLEDLKSSNGTFVNGQRLEGLIALSDGDEITLGNVELKVQASGDAGASAAPRSRKSQSGEDWSPIPGDKTARVLVAFGVGLGVLGLILWLALGGDGTKDDAEGEAAEVATEASPQDEAADAPKKDADEVSALVRQGYDRIRERQWDQALETWKKVLDRNPLHPEARKAINQITVWKTHKELLRKAQSASDKEKYGEAARLLRQIDENSEYFREAQAELKNLDTVKGSLVLRADTLVKSRDCSGAIRLLEEAQAVAPTDPDLAARIVETKKKQGRKCP